MDEGEKPNRKIAEKCVIENEEDEATQFAEAVEKKRWLPELRISSDNMLTMKISNEQRTRIFYREKLLKKKQLNTE
jgi:hypothetical protein